MGSKSYETGGIAMTTVNDILTALTDFAPFEAAESWDNNGLIAGDKAAAVTRVLAALDVTSDVIEEAVELGAELIVAHHPIISSDGLKTVTLDTRKGKIVSLLLRHGLSAISMHTNLDSVPGGVSETFARKAGLSGPCEVFSNVQTLKDGRVSGIGRIFELDKPTPLAVFARDVSKAVGSLVTRYTGAGCPVHRVGVVSGGGTDYLYDAAQAGCDTFLTGEAKHSKFLEARELGVNLVELGHYESENVIVPVLAEVLRNAFPRVGVTVSLRHQTPFEAV
jgi:dinuclear metal center YbgI/SA1388 family protein